MSFATIAVAALAIAAPASARPRSRRSSTQPPPPTTTYDSGNVNEHTHSSSTSTASCSAEVKASTWSSAVSGFTDLAVSLSKDFCNVGEYGYYKHYHNHKQLDLQIQAIASLLLESKLKCDTSGKYAIACATSWASARSYAGASFEAYAAAWADSSTDLDKCHCELEVNANADAVTSAWAEIWVSIFQGLDDAVCAKSFDGNPDSIKSEKNIACVGNYVLKYWVKAIATIIKSGKCAADKPVACEACCKDAYGGYVEGCDVDDCKTECEKAEHEWVSVTAQAAISANTHTDEGLCTKYGSVNYVDFYEAYHSKHYDAKLYYSGDASAQCEARAFAGAFAKSANAQAKVVKGIWEDTCNPYSKASLGELDFETPARAWASAYVSIYADAFTQCSASGGDPNYDGGCARAVSYSQAYAEACAEAIANSFVDYTYGKDAKCNCDIAVSTLTDALAHEIEIIFAFYETEVEARSCNSNHYGEPDVSYIAQHCIATSTADLLAKSIASVVLEGKCAPNSADKEAYCEHKCKQYKTSDPEWEPCLAECTKESDAKVTAAVKAVASIDIDSERYCNGHDDARVGETYITILNGGTTPGTPARRR